MLPPLRKFRYLFATAPSQVASVCFATAPSQIEYLFFFATPPTKLPWSGLSWSALVCPGPAWSALVCPGLPWSALVCPDLPCSALVCPGWSVLVCPGLPSLVCRQRQSTGNRFCSPTPIYWKWALLASANLQKMGVKREMVTFFRFSRFPVLCC